MTPGEVEWVRRRKPFGIAPGEIDGLLRRPD
jgi:hypothetical protein